MIKNHRQYRITMRQADRFREAVEKARADSTANDSVVRGMESMLATLDRHIREFDALLKGDAGSIIINGLHDLPKALIQARICRGLSQKDLAQQLGVKPQQIQRWEHDDYENISFSRLEEVAKVLGISQKILLREVRPMDIGTSFSGLNLNLRYSPLPGSLLPGTPNKAWEIVVATGTLRAGANDEATGDVALLSTSNGVSMKVSGMGTGLDGHYDRVGAATTSTSDPIIIEPEEQERKYASN